MHEFNVSVVSEKMMRDLSLQRRSHFGTLHHCTTSQHSKELFLNPTSWQRFICVL